MPHDLNWELRLGFLVHDVSRLRRSVVDRALKPLGVTRAQWWVLAFLSRQDGMAQVTLADQLDLTKVALGGLVDRLEVSSFVERRPDKIDRRLKRVFITAKGAALIDRIRENVHEAENSILEGIPERTLKTTVTAMRSMKANLLKILGPDDVVATGETVIADAEPDEA